MQDWLTRLENGPLSRHYQAFLGVVVAGLVVTAGVSAATVVLASSMVRHQAQQVVALQTANTDVVEDASDAYFGLHKVSTMDPNQYAVFYQTKVRVLLADQVRLNDLTADLPGLRKAVRGQEAAVSDWLEKYAEPLTHGDLKGADRAQLTEQGLQKFNAVRSANNTVDRRVDALADETAAHTRTIVVVALLVVTLLPLLAVGGVVLIGRRLSHAVVAPLSHITTVMEQLRSGQEDARAVVAGPEEVRQIAAGLNLLTEENLRASEVEADVLAQLQTIDKVRTDLVSTVSHELRTPLASIKGYLELLQDELLDTMTPQQSSMVGAMRRNLERLNELIVNLLALSRAEETELVVEPIDLRAVAIEVSADIRLTAASRDVSLRTVQPAVPVTVVGDRSQLIRAVQNLVTNAVKFSRPGGTVELRVSEEDSDEGPQAVLEVVDEGIGIPALDLPGLGSRFYRASNAVKAEIAGTGLGLRIVQTILDRHGGSLAVDSVEGEGSTFTLRLPAGGAALDVVGALVEAPLLQEPAAGPAPEEPVLEAAAVLD